MSSAENMKVLVVEDDQASLDYLRTVLVDAGYEVATAENGEQALACAQKERPRLVISDILLPEVDGFELAQKIHSQPELSHVPVIFYSTTYKEEQGKRLSEASGVTERLNKPAEPEVIVAAVKRALQRPPRPSAAGLYFLAEEHARLLSDKLASKVTELTLKQEELEREIDLRRIAQRGLEKLLLGHRSLLQHLPVGILAWSIENERLEVVNSALVQMLGYEDREQLLGRNFFDNLFVGQPSGKQLLMEASAAQAQVSREVQWKRKDGTVILVRLSCYRSQYRNDIVAVAEDITEQRALELEVRQEQKLEVLGQLAGSVAHDFNNLLMVILGCSDLLLARLADNPQQRTYAEQIRKAAESSAGLIRQLLAFSRPRNDEVKGLELNRVMTDLRLILSHLMGKRVRMKFTSQEPELWVRADRHQLEQIIVNIAVNGRDAMPEGGSMDIETFLQDFRHDPKLPPGKYVGLRVTDTGVGIESDIKGKIFQPLFSTKGERGNGWGLATVARIVEQAGGDVRVHSEVGKGSTFTVYLPHAVAKLDAAPKSLKPSSRGSESILVVDDEAAIRMASTEFLTSQGYRVSEAATASEAVSMLQQNGISVDLMVIDVSMPVMSGTDLASKARQIRPGLPVLFITGMVDDALPHTVASLPQNTGYIHKPFPLSSLVENIRRLLDNFQLGTAWQGG